MCQKRFLNFCAGDFLLDNAPQLGISVEVDSDQIETLIENDQCYVMQKIADILKISKSIKLLVRMKNVSFILQRKLNRRFVQPSVMMASIRVAWLRKGPNCLVVKYQDSCFKRAASQVMLIGGMSFLHKRWI